MEPATLATVKAEHNRTGVSGREHPSEVRGYDLPPHVREVPRVWRPVQGARLRMANGFGERIQAEVMTRVVASTREFGVRIFGWQSRGPWHWLPLASKGLTWWPIHEGE